MTLDELVLDNFGVYLGRQVVTLTPPAPERPVILIGGLNGAGKTTFLDALNLVLYGKRARCSTRIGRTPYDRFLADCIHRRAEPREASLELAFRRRAEGRERHYRVIRRWRMAGSSVREAVEVTVDGRPDRELTENWQEMVEAFIPLGLSELFLFDGETIEALAEPRNAARVLDTGVQALLGLDLVDRLVSDLQILERKKAKSLATPSERLEIDAQEDALADIELRITSLVGELEQTQAQVESLQEELDELEARCRREGGTLFEDRARIERDHAASELAHAQGLDNLRQLTMGPAPFLLVPELLGRVLEQAETEHESEQAAALASLLEERDAALLERARELRVEEPSRHALDDFLALDRRRRARAAHRPKRLSFTSRELARLRELSEGGLEAERARAAELLGTLAGHQEDFASHTEKLDAVPERETVRALIEARERTRARLGQATEVRDAIEADLAYFKEERSAAQAALARRIERQVKADFAREDLSRVVRHARDVRSTLADFRKSLLHRDLDRIQEHILDSFRALLRKSTLVSRVEIDPDSMTPTLRDATGAEIPATRLSAGERQLFAVSLLWGLARASGQRLPAVIDTPLGRLDSDHRRHLVTRYFPAASHQTLLLSTDEEIDAQLYALLEPCLGRTYHLHYDASTTSTRVEPGYPFAHASRAS